MNLHWRSPSNRDSKRGSSRVNNWWFWTIIRMILFEQYSWNDNPGMIQLRLILRMILGTILRFTHPFLHLFLCLTFCVTFSWGKCINCIIMPYFLVLPKTRTVRVRVPYLHSNLIFKGHWTLIFFTFLQSIQKILHF